MSEIKFTTADILKGVDPFWQPAVARLGAALRAKLLRDVAGARINGDRLIVPNKLYPLNNQRGLTGSQLAAVANKARQRKKGPLARFGRKYER